MSEQIKNQKEEKSLRDAAVEAIKFLGINDTDAQDVLKKWREQEDAEIATLPIEDRADAEISSLLYEAEIYFEAGEKGIALEHLNDAHEMALDEKLYDAIPRISEKIDEFSKN